MHKINLSPLSSSAYFNHFIEKKLKITQYSNKKHGNSNPKDINNKGELPESTGILFSPHELNPAVFNFFIVTQSMKTILSASNYHTRL